MKLRKATMMLAAFGMAVAPAAAASAQSSLSRAAAPVANPSYLQDEDGGGNTAVWLGLILVVLLGAIAITDGGDPDNTPASP